jgi:hypothetical protein
VQALVLSEAPQLYWEMDDKAEVEWRQFPADADADDAVHGAEPLRFTEIPTCNLQTCTEAELIEWVRQQEEDRTMKSSDDCDPGSSTEVSTDVGSVTDTSEGAVTDGSEDGHSSEAETEASAAFQKKNANLLILKPADEAASVGQAVLPAVSEDPVSMKRILGYWRDNSEMGYIAQPFFATHKILTIDFLAIDGKLKGHSMFFVDGPIKNEHWKTGLYQQVPENASPTILRQFEKIKALTERLCKERSLNGIFEIEFLYTGSDEGSSSETDSERPNSEKDEDDADSQAQSTEDYTSETSCCEQTGGHLYFLELNLLPGLYGVDKNGLMPVLERVLVPYLQHFGVEIQQRTEFEFAPEGQFYPPSQRSFQYYVDTYEKNVVGKKAS